jgi:hypothetical protein
MSRLDRHLARDLFFTLPPAGFFLLLFFKLGTPWSYIFLGLSVLFFILALQAIAKTRYN